MASLPAEKPIIIYQGDTWDMRFRLRAKTASGGRGAYLDLTGCTVTGQIRESEVSVVLADIQCFIVDQIGDSVGVVNLYLSPEQTADLAVSSAVWDFQVTFPDDAVRTIVRGPVTIWKEVTR